MSLQDTVLTMTVAVMEVAKTGRDALIDELVAGGLTGEEAQTVVDDVILVRLGPGARKAKVQQLHDAGMSQRQIAAEIGVSHQTVMRDIGPSGPERNEPEHEHEPEVVHLDQHKKEKPISQRATLTAVRQQTRGILMTLAMLRPGEVVTPAYPLMREFAQALVEWAKQWPASAETPDAKTV